MSSSATAFYAASRPNGWLWGLRGGHPLSPPAWLIVSAIACLSCSGPMRSAPFEHTIHPDTPPDIRSCLEQPAVRDHFEHLHGRIMLKWEIPPGTRADQEVRVRLQLSEKGEVVSAEVMDSGSPEFEASVLEAINAAAPLPLLPKAASCLRELPLVATFKNPKAAPAGASSETYIRLVGAGDQFRNTYLLHWPVQKMPLAVYLPPPPKGLFEDPDAVLHAVRSGVLGWTDVVRPGVPGFRFVSAHEQADIPIVWAEEPDGDWYIAFCSYQANTMRMHFGVEQILVTGRWRDGRTAEPAEVGEIVLHEMGHALGLMGHSDDPLDIMYPSPLSGKPPGLSERDRETLGELYSRGNRQIRGRRARPGL